MPAPDVNEQFVNSNDKQIFSAGVLMTMAEENRQFEIDAEKAKKSAEQYIADHGGFLWPDYTGT